MQLVDEEMKDDQLDLPPGAFSASSHDKGDSYLAQPNQSPKLDRHKHALPEPDHVEAEIIMEDVPDCHDAYAVFLGILSRLHSP
ncbi:hypothetical protein ACHAPA_011873, partial [Fusarium lateritium]